MKKAFATARSVTLAGGLWIALTAPAQLGCAGASSHVEQGEVYSTGNTEYDAFFKAVVEARELAHRGDQGAAREPLARALGLGAKADLEQTIEAAQQRAQKLHASGVSLHLQLTPEPRLLAVQGDAPIGSDGEELIKAVEEATKTSIELSKKLGALPDKCTELEKKRAELRAHSAEAFKAEKPVKRREIDRELDAAGDVLTEASSQSTTHAGVASKFVLDLARAVETGGAAAALAEASSKGKTAAAPGSAKPVTKWKGPAKGTPPPKGPATAAAPPAPHPTKPAAGGDDFEP